MLADFDSSGLQIGDPLSVAGQRPRLVAGIFEHLEAEALPEGALRVVAVPREAWRPFFERLELERETGFAAPSTNRAVQFAYRLR